MTRFCSQCRIGNCQECTGISIDTPEDGPVVPCPCKKHAPPVPAERCSACTRPVNPQTGECAGCSD